MSDAGPPEVSLLPALEIAGERYAVVEFGDRLSLAPAAGAPELSQGDKVSICGNIYAVTSTTGHVLHLEREQ